MPEDSLPDMNEAVLPEVLLRRELMDSALGPASEGRD